MTDERLERWRLVLGGGEADGTEASLSGDAARIDTVLDQLYEGAGLPRRGGLGGSAPRVARWLGEVRRLFPSSVVTIMQRDALERLDLKQMLLEPELSDVVAADVRLAADLISLASALPDEARERARTLVRRVVDDILRRVKLPTAQAVRGALRRSMRTQRPRPGEIDWNATIRANLRHYLPEHRTVVPHRRIGYGRQLSRLRDVVLAIDQSASMASSVVYAGVFGAVLASLPSVSTRVVAFNTEVVDLTEHCADPVDVLFGVQLGGGTDINRAVAYCETLVTRPRQTVMVVVTDLVEGGRRDQMLRRFAALHEAGVTIVVLLALSDDGAPAYDHHTASTLASFGIACFACTPDHFPDLMAAALERHDLFAWAAARQIVTARPPQPLAIDPWQNEDVDGG
ncbi:MAG: VWA domain-containing protein [Proteobacteria bacterium]|nr:VWA domain-containing protein [Pseudomonadota bacterium]